MINLTCIAIWFSASCFLWEEEYGDSLWPIRKLVSCKIIREIDSGSSCILIGGWVDCCQANNHLTKGKSIKVGIFENKSNELFFRLLILYVPSLWCVISFKRILIIIVMVVFEIHLVIFFFSITYFSYVIC